jgi:hypothetical protein
MGVMEPDDRQPERQDVVPGNARASGSPQFRLRSPLLLTGPPGIGKSAAARLLASRRPRCAVVEVDDIRQLVKSGAAAPWARGEGESQHMLAARNACLLAGSFLAGGFDVILTDVVLAAPSGIYRDGGPATLIVRLDASLAETRRRAGTRPVFLTWEEFDQLHRAAEAWTGADAVIDAENLTLGELVDEIDRVWSRTEASPAPRPLRDGRAR